MRLDVPRISTSTILGGGSSLYLSSRDLARLEYLDARGGKGLDQLSKRMHAYAKIGH